MDPQGAFFVDPDAEVLDGEEFALIDERAAVRTEVAGGGRVAIGPFKAVRFVLAAPTEGVALAAVGARDLEGEAVFGGVVALVDEAEAFELGSAAADDLGECSALDALGSEAVGAALLLDVGIEGG